MDDLIPTINQLQDVFNALNVDAIQLPQIAVVGSQSSGKTSVLESFVGKDLLPRGSGIVTRRPLILQLVLIPKSNRGEKEEWGEFLHKPHKKYYDFTEIQEEIQEETNRLSGKNKGISSKAIHLRIFSPNVINLTLVDLPGITKVPVGDQPEDIETQIYDLVMSFIQNPNCVILAVTPANSDLANSDALKMAKKVDPTGKRTIGVCTKLDLMDAGTDAMDMLSGKVVAVQLGFIGVVNRSQKDINNRVSMQEAREAEKQYFMSHPIYSKIANRSGTAYLAKQLNKILTNHIRTCLPELRQRVACQLQQAQQLALSYGDPLLQDVNKSSLLLQLLTKFASDFCNALDGTSRDLSTVELTGGARVSYIFHETFGATLNAVEALDGLTLNDIRTAIRNATGTKRALFVPEVSFELLVKRQIQRLLEPSVRCAELVFDELQKISDTCISTEIHRFEGLRGELSQSVHHLLRERLQPTTNLIESIIGMELAYINTNHPDFVGGQAAVEQITEKLKIQQLQQQQNGVPLNLGTSQQTLLSNFNPNTLPKISTPTGIPHGMSPNDVQEYLNHQAPYVSQYGQVDLEDMNYQDNNNNNDNTLLAHPHDTLISSNSLPSIHQQPMMTDDYGTGNGAGAGNGTGTGDRKGWFNSWFGKQKPQDTQQNNNGAPPVERGPDDLHEHGNDIQLNQRERIETELIQSLITSYFCVVRKNIQDSIPKAIMLHLVNHVKDNLHPHLISKLYSTSNEKIDALMAEDSTVAKERKEAQNLVDVLKRATKIINKIQTTA